MLRPALSFSIALGFSLIATALAAQPAAPPRPQPQATEPMPPPITKPSFDCAKTKSRVLLIVCGDDTLARLDLEEDALLRRATARAEQADAVRAEQDVWVSERNGCGGPACIASAYRRRIMDLHRWTN